MTMIDHTMGWFDIADMPTFDLEEVSLGNDEYIDTLSARVSHLFNNTWISKQPRKRTVVFDNRSEFKLDFIVFLKDFDIKPI